jgi:hypothetical protein
VYNNLRFEFDDLMITGLRPSSSKHGRAALLNYASIRRWKAHGGRIERDLEHGGFGKGPSERTRATGTSSAAYFTSPDAHLLQVGLSAAT